MRAEGVLEADKSGYERVWESSKRDIKRCEWEGYERGECGGS